MIKLEYKVLKTYYLERVAAYMFVILYGLTGAIGENVRTHFDSLGFNRMKKFYYSDCEDDIKSLTAKGHTLVSSPQNLKKLCDYSYQGNTRLVGFNKEDFSEAANGKKDVFTSVTCSDIDFLINLKSTYRDYITLIYVYFDDTTLEKVTLYYKKSLRDKRLATGKTLKHVYMKNINIFDSIVLYGGEESVFNEENLFLQLDEIVKRARRTEIKLNSQRRVALPYVGPDDYIFISYSHKDKKVVEEKLHVLQRNGFRLWYDDGLRGGENWRQVLREKIKCAKNLIVFSSANSVKSEDVKIEIITADAFEKKIVNVCLDNESFTGTVGNILHDLHAIRANDVNFEKQIIAALDKTTREPKQKL